MRCVPPRARPQEACCRSARSHGEQLLKILRRAQLRREAGLEQPVGHLVATVAGGVAGVAAWARGHAAEVHELEGDQHLSLSAGSIAKLIISGERLCMQMC